MEQTEVDPRRIIEQAVWQHGVVGEACAQLAAKILDDLVSAGWAIVPAVADDE